MDFVDIQGAANTAGVAPEEHSVEGNEQHHGGGSQLPGLVPDREDAVCEAVLGELGRNLLLALADKLQGAELTGPELHRPYPAAYRGIQVDVAVAAGKVAKIMAAENGFRAN